MASSSLASGKYSFERPKFNIQVIYLHIIVNCTLIVYYLTQLVRHFVQNPLFIEEPSLVSMFEVFCYSRPHVQWKPFVRHELFDLFNLFNYVSLMSIHSYYVRKYYTITTLASCVVVLFKKNFSNLFTVLSAG